MFGAAAALELSHRNHVVTVVDRGPLPHPDASSTDVSKMVRMDYGSDVFYHELADASIEGWRRWNAGWDRPLYHDDGFLVLSPATMRPGGFEFESFRVLRERGFTPERIGGRELSTRFPSWNGSAYADGYISRPGGWAESGAVVAELLAAAARRGVRFVSGAFVGLVAEGSRVRGVRVASAVADGIQVGQPEERLDADAVVLCAGAWTPELHPVLDRALSVVAQPVVHFRVDRPADYRPPHFLPFAADISGTGWYGFPALADGRLKLGHHGDGRRVSTARRGVVSDEHIANARAFLARAIPSLADAPVAGSRVCLYSDSFDGDLIVDADPAREGVVVAAGGSGHGFKFAPMLGSIIADVMEGRDNPWRTRFRWRLEGTAGHEEARMTTNQD